MLTALRIKNLALVDDLLLEPDPGYNAITGETGAGKSILIGALGLVLGGRADRSLIRDGDLPCTVEAVIDASKLGEDFHLLIAEGGAEPCDQEQLFLKRTFSASGANRQFINGSPVTLGTLATIGDCLVDIHGPHDHQSLLQPIRQLEIIDAFAGLDDKREAFANCVRERGTLETEKRELVVDEQVYVRELDLLRFQVNEIEAARLRPDEEPELDRNFRQASNAARLAELASEADALLEGGQPGLTGLAGGLGRVLQEIEGMDPAAKDLTESHAQISGFLADLQRDLSAYTERLEMDPARLHELEQRFNLIQSLKRKYGGTLEEVIQFGEQAAERLAALEGRDEELARIQATLDQVNNKLMKTGRALSRSRQKSIPELVKKVVRQLADLGFLRARFDVQIKSTDIQGHGNEKGTLHGLDRIEFLFAPNPGEPFKPLKAIASSGEMARVMLALKTVLAAHDRIPILIFDEVDSNIGGETAGVVGDKMREVGEKRQVLCITHLAPAAAVAMSHWRVAKEVMDGRTLTRVQKLKPLERVAELARMLGGGSDAARRHAKELLEPAS